MTAMPQHENDLYEFGPFRVDRRQRVLLHGEAVVRLSPKAFDTLLVLVERAGSILKTDELLEQVWPDEPVELNNVTQKISELRKAFKGRGGYAYIETIPKRGYRFNAVVVAGSGIETDYGDLINMVGREAEKAELRQRFEGVSRGRGFLLSVTGEAGIGKTSLVGAFLAEADGSGLPCLIARAMCSDPMADAKVYLPLFHILRNLLSYDKNFKRLAPVWYDLISGRVGEGQPASPAGGAAKELSRAQLTLELLSFLQQLSASKPLIFFIEDIHWADVSTLAMLSYIADNFGDVRVLVIVTYRMEDMYLREDSPFLKIQNRLKMRGDCLELRLDALGLEDVAEYLKLLYPSHRLPAEFAEVIHNRTGGNPFFMVEVLHLLRKMGVLVEEQDGCRLARPVPDIERELPESINSLIDSEIQLLKETDVSLPGLIEAASVQGYEFDSAVLAKALRKDVVEVETHLRKLDRARAFVRFVGESTLAHGTPSLRYSFIHPIHYGAFDTRLKQEPARRARLNAAVAEAILAYYDQDNPEVISQLTLLFEQAREHDKALMYLCLAAQNAARLSAFKEAHDLAERGLGLVARIKEGRAKSRSELALLNIKGIATMAVKGFAAAELEGIYTRSVKLSRQLKDFSQLHRSLYGLWVYHIDGGRLVKAHELGRKLLALSERLQDDFTLIESHYALGTVLIQLGNLKLAQHHLRSGVSCYDPERHSTNRLYYQLDPGVSCLSQLARTLWLLGSPDEALQTVKKALELAQGLEHPESYSYALAFAGDIHYLRREMSDALEYLEASIQHASNQGLVQELSWASVVRGAVLAELGRVAEGIAALKQHLEHYRAIGSEVARTKFLCLLADAYLKSRQIQDGLETLEEAFDSVQSTGEHYYEAELYRTKGELLLIKNGADRSTRAEAERHFVKAARIANRQRANALELRAVASRARLCRTHGKAREVREQLAEVCSRFTEGLDTKDLVEARALLKELS